MKIRDLGSDAFRVSYYCDAPSIRVEATLSDLKIVRRKMRPWGRGPLTTSATATAHCSICGRRVHLKQDIRWCKDPITGNLMATTLLNHYHSETVNRDYDHGHATEWHEARTEAKGVISEEPQP